MANATHQPGWYPDPSGTPGQRYFDGARWTPQYAPPSIVINNSVNTPPAVVAGGANHALHLILTLLTCGMWLPVWLIVAAVSRPHVRVPGQTGKAPATIAAVLVGLFFLGFVAIHPGSLMPLAVLAAVGYLGYRAYERAVERRTENARIAARADAEHQAMMRGEPSGLYGQYPPPPPPTGWF